MESVYVINGLVTVFENKEDAEKFRQWYNKKNGTDFWKEVEDIKEYKLFLSYEDAIEYSTQPEGYEH
jgi:hypothetical protein